MKTLHAIAMMAALAVGAAWAKIPPPPPPDPAAKAAADEKKAKDAEKAKADLTAAEERAIKNYHANMKKMGKPIPKPMPVAAKSEPPKGGTPAPESNTAKAEQKAKEEAAAKKKEDAKKDAKKS